MTDQPPAGPSFNLWLQPWIRVLARDGTLLTVGLEECLLRAHEFHSIADPAPPTVGGTHRLLAAIAQDVYRPREVADVGELFETARFESARIAAFGQRYAGSFELFHPTAPFLQTGDIPLDALGRLAKGKKAKQSHDAIDMEPQTVAYLLADIPTATNRSHFRHVLDSAHRLCPACCARALVTYSAFAPNGGRGWRASINGDPPVYVLPVSDTLFHALALSLMSQPYQPDTAEPTRQGATVWAGTALPAKGEPVSRVGYIESLTFPARRVRLFPADDPGACTRCGEHGAVRVAQMFWQPGAWREKPGNGEKAALWQDPFVAYRLSKESVPTPLRLNGGKALWREYATLFFQLPEQAGGKRISLRPRVVEQAEALSEAEYVTGDRRLAFRCVGMQTDKAKVFAWSDETYEVPPALLLDAAHQQALDEDAQRAGDIANELTRLFKRSLLPLRMATKREGAGGGKDGRERFKAIKERMEEQFWLDLAAPFRTHVHQCATPVSLGELRAAWALLTLRTGQRVFLAALAHLGESAEMLRQRAEADSACRRMVARKRKEWDL